MITDMISLYIKQQPADLEIKQIFLTLQSSLSSHSDGTEVKSLSGQKGGIV